MKRAEAAGAWLVQNPRSNANNRVGYPRALYASRRVAVGTDGFPADMSVEHRALREETAKHGGPADAAAVEARCRDGARVAEELDTRTASDLVTELPGDGSAPAGRRDVIVDGRIVVRNGELVLGDIDEIRARAAEQAKRLWSRMNDLPGAGG